MHQFEKVEQFCITDPASSWAEFDRMIANSEEFYQSIGLPYRVVEIVSGALNNAAAKKYDLEAWFPFQGEYKELVSVSKCVGPRRGDADLAAAPTTVRASCGCALTLRRVPRARDPLRRQEAGRPRQGLVRRLAAARAHAPSCHMLNGTLAATGRALCCIVENFQTPEVPRPALGWD